LKPLNVEFEFKKQWEWTKTFERLWQHQLNRVKERAEARAASGKIEEEEKF